MKRSLSRWPLNLIFGLLLIALLALAGRLWMLLREGQARAIQATEKQERITIPVPGRPGSIYMRARDSFALLAEGGLIPPELANRLQGMVGFRNTLVHQYRQLDLQLMQDVITHHFDDLLRFSDIMLEAAGADT